MNKIRNLKVIQLVIIAVIAIIGYVLIFRQTSAREMFLNTIPIAYLYFVFTGLLAVMLIFLLLDFIMLTRLQTEKQGLDRLTYLDPVTGGLNRRSADILDKKLEEPEILPEVGCFMFRLTNLVDINQAAGHKEGDILLRSFYSLLENITKDKGLIVRNNPDRFIVLLEHSDKESAALVTERVQKAVVNYNVDRFDCPIEYVGSVALNCEEHKNSISELIASANTRLK